MAKYSQKEREIIITYSDKPAPEMLPTYFIHEMRRVIDERKKREEKEK